MSVLFPHSSKLFAIALLGLSLGACSSGSGGLGLPSLGGSSSAKPAQPGTQMTAREASGAGQIVDSTTNLILNNAKKLNSYCPSVSILGDTNVYRSYAKGGQDNPSKLIHQANINQTARECSALGEEMFIKVGVAGRVLGGPASKDNSTANLPLRIVVKQEGSVLFSKLYKVPVTLAPPARSALFAKVEEAIAIPTPRERNVQILVGFDSESSGKR